MTSLPEATLDDIKKALATDAFEFYYQPKVNFTSGRICGGEALIRWRTENGRLIPPICFIPVAEKAGFISEITKHMFPRLLRDYQRVAEVAAGTHVAFNISASDLEHDDLVVALEEAVEKGRIPPACLSLEVTEAAALGSTPNVRHLAERLVAQGVELAMDDFGTGYATLDAVRKLPFSTLKIDQGIVCEMETSERSSMLVHANVSLAQILGMETVAEGIETQPIYETLMHSGCREGQGYWMSRPLPLPEYIEKLKANPSWPASQGGPLRTALMGYVIELRRTMDWAFASRAEGPEATTSLPPPFGSSQHLRFIDWYQGDGQILKGNRTFSVMQSAQSILSEAFAALHERASRGATAQELSPLVAKISHYTVVLIGDLLRLESELRLAEIQRRPSDPDL